MVKRNTEPVSQTCLRCGGLHFGSYRCPYLDVAVCFACLKTIAAEYGSDPHVHPNRKYDAIGRVYHSGCPLSEIDYSCSVDASRPSAPRFECLSCGNIAGEKQVPCDACGGRMLRVPPFPRDPESSPDGWNVEALMLGVDKPKPAPTVRDAMLLIEKMDKCDGMPAKLILLRNFILFVAGRLSDWP